MHKRIDRYIRESEYFIHETKKSVVSRFLIVAAIVVLYFSFVSIKYGTEDGLLITFLSWSFFVFCTPVADAGFLLDFPVRMITKVRMIYSEIMVWTVAFGLNAYALTFNPSIYRKTLVLDLFRTILLNPFPFWGIIIISAVGTFISIYFGDELIDVAKHKERKKYLKHRGRHRIVIMLFICAVTLFLYHYLLTQLGIEIF
ncbi:MAG: hypothetical protein GXO64_00665 [Candidatus Micrarchaeota archaeon]|nr:hypothetical protein [Candidatus Micrarchaeota archaeon]